MVPGVAGSNPVFHPCPKKQRPEGTNLSTLPAQKSTLKPCLYLERNQITGRDFALAGFVIEFFKPSEEEERELLALKNYFIVITENPCLLSAGLVTSL